MIDIDNLKRDYNKEYLDLKEVVINCIKNNNLKYDNTNKFIEISCYICLLTLTTNLSFIDMSKVIFEKYNIKVKSNPLFRDIIQYMFKLCCKLKLNISEEELNKRYQDYFKDVDDRMFIRIELFKEGWNTRQIENYICKFILKNNYLDDIDFYEYENMLYLLFSTLKLTYKKNMNHCVGRPKLPDSVKLFIKNKIKEKMRESMRIKYEESTKYEKIKNNLLTLDEFDYLKNKIEDKNILDKITNFVLQ
jgi:hypothetical protein